MGVDVTSANGGTNDRMINRWMYRINNTAPTDEHAPSTYVRNNSTGSISNDTAGVTGVWTIQASAGDVLRGGVVSEDGESATQLNASNNGQRMTFTVLRLK
jgi:hypothetical protein